MTPPSPHAAPSTHLVAPQYYRRELFGILATAAAFPATMGLVIALVPQLMAEMHLDKATIGLIQALPGVLALLLGAPVARLANTRWRRWTVTGVFVLMLTACLLLSLAREPLMLIIPQLLLGVAAAAFWSNMIASSFRLATGPRQSAIQGYHTAMQGIGYFLGPLVGGYLASTSYRNGFYAGAVLALLGLGASLAYAPARAIEPSQGFWRDFRGSYARLVRIFTTRRLVLLGAALVFLQCFLTFVMGGSFLLIYAREIGLSAFVASALLSGRDGVSSLVRLSYGAVSRRISPLVLIAVGIALGSGLIALVPSAHNALGMALITLSLGAAVAFMPPAVNMLSGASAAPEEQSFAIVSLNVANYAAQTVLSPLLGVALARWGYGRAYPLMGAVWVVLALVTLCIGQKVMRAHRSSSLSASG